MFDNVGVGYGFSLRRVHIWESASDPTNPVPSAFYSPNDYLETIAQHRHHDWSEYCLVHMLTHRDMDDGVLGLAWVGAPSAMGGICDTGGLNTGFTTGLNFGRNVREGGSLEVVGG